MKMIVLLVASALCAQDNPADILMQAREKLLSRTNALNKYTCVQTVDRSYFVRNEATQRPSCDQISATRKRHAYKFELDHTDRLRFEVSLPSAQELFSWTDSGHFESLNLNELIEYGPNATGTFGTYLVEILLGAATHFQYRGRDASSLEYGFNVSPEGSRSLFKGAGQWMPTAYDGKIWINSQSLDIERLTVDTSDLPPETGLCAAETVLDYRQAGLAVPREGRTRFILREGHQEIENRTTFSSCRESQPRAPRPQPTLAELPDNLPVTLELISPIDSDNSAEGDPITARVTKDVVGSQKVYLVQGSIVRGRLLRLEHHQRPNRFLLTLVFETIEIAGIEHSVELMKGAQPQSPSPAGVNTLRALQTLTVPAPDNRIVLPNKTQSCWHTGGLAASANGRDPCTSPQRFP